ncbi:phosphotransferase enzyme family protein [Candidatus Poribacteria bacterium]
MRSIPTTQDFNSVLKQYALGPLSSDAEREGGASSNVNFALDTPQGRYFCRVRGGFREKDTLLHSVLAHLTEKQFQTAPLMHTTAGGTYVQHENRFYELFPFIQGEEFQQGNLEQFAAMGGLLAQFHQCMRDFGCPIPLESFEGFFNNYPDLHRQEDFIQYARQEIQSKEDPTELRQRLSNALAQIRQALEQVTSNWKQIESDLPRVFVHGDYHPGNVLFKGNEAAYACDFDFVMPAERIYDIITALVWWSWPPPESGEKAPPDASYLEACREFLANYNVQSIQPLTAQEMQALVPDMQRQLLLYGSKAANHCDDLPGMLTWVTRHLKQVEWLERYRTQFEHGFS